MSVLRRAPPWRRPVRWWPPRRRPVRRPFRAFGDGSRQGVHGAGGVVVGDCGVYRFHDWFGSFPVLSGDAGGCRRSRGVPDTALGQPVKDWGPKRPHATKTARASRARGTTIAWVSWRRTCVMIAPIISNTTPAAASGTRTGAMFMRVLPAGGERPRFRSRRWRSAIPHRDGQPGPRGEADLADQAGRGAHGVATVRSCAVRSQGAGAACLPRG